MWSGNNAALIPWAGAATPASGGTPVRAADWGLVVGDRAGRRLLFAYGPSAAAPPAHGYGVAYIGSALAVGQVASVNPQEPAHRIGVSLAADGVSLAVDVPSGQAAGLVPGPDAPTLGTAADPWPLAYIAAGPVGLTGNSAGGSLTAGAVRLTNAGVIAPAAYWTQSAAAVALYVTVNITGGVGNPQDAPLVVNLVWPLGGAPPASPDGYGRPVAPVLPFGNPAYGFGVSYAPAGGPLVGVLDTVAWTVLLYQVPGDGSPLTNHPVVADDADPPSLVTTDPGNPYGFSMVFNYYP